MKRRILLLALAACYLVLGISAGPFGSAQAGNENSVGYFTVSYTTYDTTYAAILKMYLKVINGYQTKNFGRHDLFNIWVVWDGPSDAPAKTLINYAKENVGFYIEDINNDGVDELVINATLGRIYEIFTLDNGKVRELFRGSRHAACHLLNNHLIYRCIQMEGEPFSYYELWQLNGTGKAIFLEGYHGPDTPGSSDAKWYKSSKGVTKLTHSENDRVSSEEAERWVVKQEKRVVRHRFIPFGVYEKFPEDPWNIGVLAKDNKTSTSVKIRIRKEARSNSKVIMTRKVGTYVKILEKVEGFYKIQIGKKEGYVQEEYLIPVTWEEKTEPEG